MKTSVRSITPGFAKDVLATKNTNNRRREPKREKAFADLMRRGEFMLTHQGIAFDEDGVLIDGQTRLAAVVDYGQPVQMMVTVGVPRNTRTAKGLIINAIDPLDSGRPRSIGQKLQMGHGVQNANQVASVCNVIRYMVSPTLRGVPMTAAQVLFVRELFSSSILRVLETKWQKGDIKAPLLAAFVIYHSAYPEKCEEFMLQVTEMDGLPAKSPALVWRKWVINHLSARGGTRGDRLHLAYITASACLKHSQGQEAHVLKDTPAAMSSILAVNVKALKAMREYFCDDRQDDGVSEKLT